MSKMSKITKTLKQIKSFCDYSDYVESSTYKCCSGMPKELSAKLGNDEYIKQIVIFWYLSKLIEDEYISLDDYVKYVKADKDTFINKESILFDYYLKNDLFRSYLNGFIFPAATGTDSGLELPVVNK